MSDNQIPESPVPEPDPIEPPEAPVPQPAYARPPFDNSASHGKRLAAVIVDWVVMILCLSPAVQYLGLAEMVEKQIPIPLEMVLKMLAFQYCMFFVLHGFLLIQSGQTIGKRLLNIAIVTLDGAKPPFLTLALNRYLAQWAIGLMPVVGPVFRVVDWLFIFREDKRCIHDHFAKTRVIDLRLRADSPNSLIV